MEILSFGEAVLLNANGVLRVDPTIFESLLSTSGENAVLG